MTLQDFERCINDAFGVQIYSTTCGALYRIVATSYSGRWFDANLVLGLPDVPQSVRITEENAELFKLGGDFSPEVFACFAMLRDHIVGLRVQIRHAEGPL